MPEYVQRIADKWDKNHKGSKFEVNGLDATYTDTGNNGIIHGTLELTNKGEHKSLYYAEFKINKDSEDLDKFIGISRKLKVKDDHNAYT